MSMRVYSVYSYGAADMLRHDDIRRKDASVRCMEVLTSSKPEYWKQLLDAGQSKQQALL